MINIKALWRCKGLKLRLTQVDSTQNTTVIARRLQFISRRTLPIFTRIANDRLYTTRLVRAIRALNFNRVEQLIRQGGSGVHASVGAGFGAGLNLGNQLFEVGIFRPGQIIRTNDIRAVSRIMLPLLRRIANSRSFARQMVRQFLLGRPAALLRLARIVVSVKQVRNAYIDNFGFSFVVRLPNGANYNFIFGILL